MEARVDPILRFAGVWRFAHMPVKYFSTEMALRLGFAVATDILPEILVVDEVFAGGDAAFRRRATARMRELIDTAKILAMVSHDLDLMRKQCSRMTHAGPWEGRRRRRSRCGDRRLSETRRDCGGCSVTFWRENR